MTRWAALVLALGVLALTALRYTPPAPLAVDAPERLFSGARARAELEALVGDGVPHPVGSPAAARVREKVVERFRQLGYAPEVQEAYACTALFTCSKVKNVIAVRPGQQEGKAVLISAHYDSVGAGPGASDDGAGTAVILEVARALAQEPPAPNPVVFLVNEGEEGGLGGAEAFVARHPWGERIGAVVNLEARGSGGPSLMFETHEGNGPAVSLVARSLERPAANSIYYTVYKLLPNDTDLTVYKRVGYPGVNFAYSANEVHYHTPLDDLGHLDPGSLQHHGQNALAMVRAFSRADLGALRGEDHVFFDLLTFSLVHFPLSWMRVLAVVAAVLALGAGVLASRRGGVTPRQVAWGGLGALGGALLALLLGALGLGLLYAVRATPYLSLAVPAPALAAFLLVGLLGALLAGALLFRRAGAAGLWYGTLALWGLGSLGLGLASPPTAYPFVLPTLAGALAALTWAWRPAGADHPGRAWAALFIVALPLWMPVTWLLYDGVGVLGFPITALVIALLASPLLHLGGPLAQERRWLFGLGGAVVLLLALAAVMPRYTPAHPQKLSLDYVLVHADAPQPTARWAAVKLGGALPEPLRAAAAFSEDVAPPLPWKTLFDAYVAPAPVLAVPPPEFRVDQVEAKDGVLRIRGALRSVRGAPLAGIVLPEGRFRAARVHGQQAPAQRSKNLAGKVWAADGWANPMTQTAGAEEVPYELELAGEAPIEAWLWDASWGLPPEGKALLEARPKTAVPFQDGDRTTVARKVRLGVTPPTP